MPTFLFNYVSLTETRNNKGRKKAQMESKSDPKDADLELIQLWRRPVNLNTGVAWFGSGSWDGWVEG